MPPVMNADATTITSILHKAEQIALRILEWHLSNQGKSLEDYVLPVLDDSVPPYDPVVHRVDNFINHYHAGDPLVFIDDSIPVVKLGVEQQYVYDKILEALHNAPKNKNIQAPNMIFVHAGGGTGKTTLFGQLIRICRENKWDVMATASTGVAAMLLPNGATVHSRFYVPVGQDLSKESRMPYECQQASYLRKCRLILIDEASQISKGLLDYIMQTLENVRPADSVDHQLVIVWGGDFRQLLPVVPGGSIDEAFEDSLVSKYPDGMKFYALNHNHRTDDDQVEFRKYLMDIGSGRNFAKKLSNYRSEVNIPKEITLANDLDELIEAIFPAKAVQNEEWVQSAILSPRNANVNLINSKVLQRFKGEIRFYDAVNTVLESTVDPTDESGVAAMNEAMAMIDETGLPEQRLGLKVGAKVFLTRNIQVSMGLCNGTTGIVRQLDDDVITIQVIRHDGNLGDLFDIVRISVERKADAELGKIIGFTRTQFPIKLCFAMTIHKAQGQTLGKVGLSIDTPMFTSGMLYVALSRVRRIKDIVIFNATGKDTIENNVHSGISKFLDELDKDKDAQPSSKDKPDQ